MSKLKNKKGFFIFLMVLLFLLISHNEIIKVSEKIRVELYGEPISNDGKINNNYFNIDSSGNRECAKEINTAIKYAYKNNIKDLKMEKGKYLINGISSDINSNETDIKKGVVLFSNITLDLNGSIVKIQQNDKVNYAVLSVYDIENVTIQNGIIEGDKEEHNYNNRKSTHEWGFGIDIRGSRNVKINNMEIYNCTGDGIIITDYIDRNNYSKNITIKNTEIHNCRRNGISVISAEEVEISDNSIYEISGTSPRFSNYYGILG